jgi:hypothetical protein
MNNQSICMRVTCRRWINSTLLTTSYALSVTIVVGRVKTSSRRERPAVSRSWSTSGTWHCLSARLSVLQYEILPPTKTKSCDHDVYHAVSIFCSAECCCCCCCCYKTFTFENSIFKEIIELFSSDETTGAASPLVLWLESDQPADNSVILPPRRPEF